MFGLEGEGSGGGGKGELVVEVLSRGAGEGRKRGVERVLEGWSVAKGGPCELTSLESLKSIWTRKVVEEVGISFARPVVDSHRISLRLQGAPDPTQNVSFNLNLTASQQQSRAQVPLPYAHEGKFLALHVDCATEKFSR